VRLVFFTRAGFASEELFRYLFSKVADRFSDLHIVAVRPPKREIGKLRSLARRYRRKVKLLGVWDAVEVASGSPLQALLARRAQRDVRQLLRALPRSEVQWDRYSVHYVETVNGDDAVKCIGALEPDVIIQAGAGILRPQVFELARIGTLNLHHGIAPLIRGMNSIHWALWEDRPEWLGATVHWIDAGIDTGGVLAYARVKAERGEGFPALYVRATEGGVERLVESLVRLDAGERWVIPSPGNGSEYRSTISGWKLALVQGHIAIQRLLERRRIS
jgi:hypothetical protein